MPSRTDSAIPLLEGVIETEPVALTPQAIVWRFRQDILDGIPWFDALLDAIGKWRLPEETLDERHYRYLIGSEAFDWLLLAERLLDEAEDLVPRTEREALLFDGRSPTPVDESEFRDRIGPAKHSAHLNFLYGVLVEQALQLHVEEEIHKEVRARVWGQDERVDETMHERVYGCRQKELFARYYEDTGRIVIDEIDLAGLQEFTYWLFKHRLASQDKARIASDTRKGLAQLSRMELAVNQRRGGSRLSEDEFAERYIA